jgi:rod shape-determining protein MreC
MISLREQKPAVFLGAVLLLNLLLLSVQVQTGDGRLLIRAWGLMIFAPFATGVHLVTKPIVGALNQYVLLYDAETENRYLREENMQLRAALPRLQGIEFQSWYKKDPLQVQEQFAFNTFWASVVWKSPPFYAHRLVINAGGEQGIRRDTAIINADGIVGRVWSTTDSAAEVELITNFGAAAGGMLKDSRLQGVVQGDGTRLLRWNFIPNYELVVEGDVVYTSGHDQIYPKGLPIGKVVKSTKGAVIYRDIWVEPFVDYLRLEEILVVSDQNVTAVLMGEKLE